MYNNLGLPPVSKITRPYPAIVIAVGNPTIQLAHQVMRIYLRGDARRAKSVTFYQLLPDEKNRLVLTELEAGAAVEYSTGTEDNYLEKRGAALLSAVGDALLLKTRLESILHEQRTHERLISTGWADKFEIPLNFYILGDVNDPWTAGILLPLGTILNDILSSTRLCRLHWLLNIAVFPEDAKDQNLKVWSFLQALDDFLRLESKTREKLTKTLKMQVDQAPDYSIYLFDRRKEGSAEVRDREMLKTHMGNALLALLQEDLAGQFLNKRDLNTMYDRHNFYASIGSAALIYDPDALQIACALRSGYTFLQDKILCEPQDGQAAIQYKDTIQEKLGEIYHWVEKMCLHLSPVIGPVSIKPDLSEILPQFTDLSLPALDYERVNQTPWASRLRAYYDNFRQVILAQVNEQLNSNLEELKAQVQGEMNTALNQLPQEVSLYPGGVKNGLGVLELLNDNFKHTTSNINATQERLPKDISAAEAQFSAKCGELEKLLSKIPIPPWWVRILPTFVRKWLALLVMTLFHGHKLLLANQMQAECISLLQRLCGLHILQQALSLLVKIPSHLQRSIKRAKTDLKVFEKKLIQARETFSPEWSSFPLGAAENGWDPLFRQMTTGQELADWAYTKWHPDFNTWVQDFLASPEIFGDWRMVEVKGISSWIEQTAARAYQPVWSLSLDDIFSLWEKEPVSFPADKDLSPATIRVCMLAAIPPARPNFDAVGGSHGAGVSFHFVTGDLEWDYCNLPSENNRAERWEIVCGCDPYLALFVQTHHGFPLKALVDSFQDAWRWQEDLPEQQQQAYDLLRSLDPYALPIKEIVDPDSPDLVHKTFQWKFQPKGSNKEIEQTIELAISRSRFEYYRRQPRFSGQWNLYAELEMPEIRDLAAEFQRLHARHKWSTFNQAYNVLKFVQSCIPYSHDKDTTGHGNWARYPIETLMEGTGDCEDAVILCTAVIARLGFQAVLLLYPSVADFKTHHLAFGVAGADNLKGDYVQDPKTGLRYFYGEATANGWYLGEIPKEYMSSFPNQILHVDILLNDAEQ